MFTLSVRYLTGYVRATSASSFEDVEWPPHPARVFMALAASLFETRPEPEETDRAQWEQERRALEWLESLGAPDTILVPSISPEVHRRTVVTVFVPPNDFTLTGKETFEKALSGSADSLNSKLQILPERRNLRQPRTFPTIHVGDGDVRFAWRHEAPDAEIKDALASLCSKVIRVGHSASLAEVRVSIEERAERDFHNSRGESELLRYELSPEGGLTLRTFEDGMLQRLVNAFGEDEIEAFHNLNSRILSSKGKEQKALKETFEKRFGKWSKTALPPEPQRPTIVSTAAFARRDETSEGEPKQTPFSSEIQVLAKVDGPVLGLESTLQLTQSLRNAMLQVLTERFSGEELPPWTTGHEADGAPVRGPHLAIVPLPYVTARHADGHILGLGLIRPEEVTDEEVARWLGPLLFDLTPEKLGEPRELRLWHGQAWEWTVHLEEGLSRPKALESRHWTGAVTSTAVRGTGACRWASVTPVVLDRHPKIDRRKDFRAWREAAIELVLESLKQQAPDLPEPDEIDLDKTSWHRGAPRAWSSGAFPNLRRPHEDSPRQQVHVYLRFSEPVRGPLLLGAGRFRGYGFFKPLPGQGGHHE